MRRVVVVEEGVRRQLGFSPRGCDGIGVLVGRLTAKSSFVLLYVPTPSLGRSQAGRTERDGVGQGLPVEEWWVEDHAHQVWDMLPGGVSVVGLCLTSPALSGHAAASLSSLARQLCEPRESLPPCLLPDRLLVMHFSTTTEKLTCRQLDRCSAMAPAQPVEVTVQHLADSWCRLESTVPVQLETLIPSPHGDPCLGVQQKLIEALESWRLGLVVLGGQSCSGEEPVAGYVEEGCVECTLYPRHKAMQCGRSCVVDRACSLSVQGSVAAVASVPLEATVAEASEALSADVVQTVAVRWRRMCEDLQEHDVKQMTGRQQLPQRVKVFVKGWMFCLCAYQFSDETREEVCERVCEVLGLEGGRVAITCCEQGLSTQATTAPPVARHASLPVWVVVVAVLVGLAAVLLLAVL